MKTPDESKCGMECIRTNVERLCIKPEKGQCPRCKQLVNDSLAYIQRLESRLAQAERERDAAVADLKSVDEKYEALKSLIDDVIFNHEPYGLYLDFREAADAIVEHEHADVWRGVCPENTKEEGK